MSDTVPDTMTCIEISEPSKECDVLKPVTRPVPALAGDEVLIKVEAAGVNRPDLAQRAGYYPPPPGVTDIPGLEVAGTIVSIGGNVSKWQIGDKVTALVAGGGYAEYCPAPAVQVLPVPKGLSMVEAAAIPETFFTVWSNVFDRCAIQKGETLLIHGGSSGIGTTAIMVAKNLGNRVIVTAGSGDKCQACLDLGADLAINYKDQDFVEEVNSFTDGNGADVVIDMVAGDYIQRDLDCQAVEGRICIIAMLGGAKAEVDFSKVFRKRAIITGSTLRARSAEFKGKIADALLDRVWPLFEDGKIKPIIHETVPLQQAATGHQILENGQHIGKVVLTV